MKWIIFTGTWQLTNEEVERDVRHAVREVLARGDAIITGGALGVDWFALDEAMKCDQTCERIMVIIPTKLEIFTEYLKQPRLQGKISMEDFEKVTTALETLKSRRKESLVEMDFTDNTRMEYFARNQEEVNRGDAVYAFQVNDSQGTQDTIDKAIVKGIPILLHKKYSIEVS